MDNILPSERRRRSARYMEQDSAKQARPADTAEKARVVSGGEKRTAAAEPSRPNSRESSDAGREMMGTRGYRPVDTGSTGERTTKKKKTGDLKKTESRTQKTPARKAGSMPVQNQASGAFQTTGSMPVQGQAMGGFQTTGSMPVQGQAAGGFQSTGGMHMTGEMPQTGYQAPGYYPPAGQFPGNQIPAAQQGFQPSGSMPVAGYPVNGPSQGIPRNGTGIYPAAYVQQMGQGYAPPPKVPVQGSTPGRREPEKPKKSSPGLRRALIILLIAAVVAVLGLIGVRVYRRAKADRELRAAVEPFNDRYVEGVYVDGLSLGGLTQEQARDLVYSNAQQRSDSWSVRLTYQGQLVREISAGELGMQVNVEDALRDAWTQGHEGTLEERRAAMEVLRQNSYQTYTANPSGDTSVIDGILSDIANAVYRPPADASIATFNPDLTYPFTFNEEVVGRSLNVEPVKQEIYHRMSSMQSGEIELDFTMTEPQVTVQYLKDHVVALRGTATTPISSHSTEDRNNNIRVAFSRVSGTILQPGQQFSFNNIVGERTTKNGFFPAIEYAYKELVEGVGGGVCQASTTVYLAAVRAGMNIIKREPHSREVSYTEFGKDATVYWYSNHKIDMVFKNTSASPVYITASVQSSNTKKVNLMCVVNIYGADLGGVSYDIETVLTPIEAPTEPKYVKDRNAEYVTYTDQEYVYSKAKEGTIVDAYLVTYEGGNVVDRRYLYTDTYDAEPQVIYVGVSSRDK